MKDLRVIQSCKERPPFLPRKYEEKKATTKLSWDMVEKDSILQVGVLFIHLDIIDFR